MTSENSGVAGHSIRAVIEQHVRDWMSGDDDALVRLTTTLVTTEIDAADALVWILSEARNEQVRAELRAAGVRLRPQERVLQAQIDAFLGEHVGEPTVSHDRG